MLTDRNIDSSGLDPARISGRSSPVRMARSDSSTRRAYWRRRTIRLRSPWSRRSGDRSMIDAFPTALGGVARHTRDPDLGWRSVRRDLHQGRGVLGEREHVRRLRERRAAQQRLEVKASDTSTIGRQPVRDLERWRPPMGSRRPRGCAPGAPRTPRHRHDPRSTSSRFLIESRSLDAAVNCSSASLPRRANSRRSRSPLSSGMGR